MAFFRPCQAMGSHNGAGGAPGGINKVAWGARLLPTSTSARGMVWAHCGCFCQLLPNSLAAWVSSSLDPPSPPPPYTYMMTLVIYYRKFSKPLKNQLFQLAANFIHAMLAIRQVFFWCKSGVATIKL